MTREQKFKEMRVSKGNHWCMFCDNAPADFVIEDDTVSPMREYSMCNKCAALFKTKITDGMRLSNSEVN